MNCNYEVEQRELISVIVPVYNVEMYLEKCINSILQQSYNDIEIILVDDGSTDKSSEICKKYSSRDSRIFVYHKDNGGLSDARNYGIERATGSFYLFVDSDDYITEDCVEYLLELIKKYNADIAIGNIECIDPEGKTIGTCSNSMRETVYNQKDALYEILDTRIISNSASAKLYKSCLFETIRYPVGRIYEDVATTYKTFLNSSSIVHGDKVVYKYLFRTGSISKTAFSKKNYDLVEFAGIMVNDITTKYPDLYLAGSYRMFDSYMKLVSICEDKSETKKLMKHLKEYRKDVLLSPKSGFKRMIFAFSTLFGSWFIKWQVG